MSAPQVWLGLLAIAGSVIFTERTFFFWSLVYELVTGKGGNIKQYKRDNEEPLLTEPHKIGAEPINFTEHASSGGRPTG